MIRTRWGGVIYVVLLLCLNPSRGLAKDVVVEWKAIASATSYEIAIKRSSKNVLSRKIEKPIWEGDLDFGVYSYEIRAIDKFGRFGPWSEARALVVTPGVPKPESPGEGDVVAKYADTATITFEWKPTPGIRRYKVEVFDGSKVVATRASDGSLVQVDGVSTGRYSWQVSALIDAPEDDAQFSGKTWQGPAQKGGTFTIVRKELEKPRLVSPLESTVISSEERAVRFKWDAVDGASGYELKITSNNTAPAIFKVASTSYIFKNASVGPITWAVRAYTSGANGPWSQVKIALEEDVGGHDGRGLLMFTPMLGQPQYLSSGPLSHYSTRQDPTTARAEGVGEFWFRRQLGVEGNFVYSDMKLLGKSVSFRDAALYAKYRFTVGDAVYGVNIIPKIGIGYLDFPQVQRLSPTSDEFNLDNPKVLGLAFGVDLRKQLSKQWSAWGTLQVFHPWFYANVVGSSLEQQLSANAAAKVIYWISDTWGFGAGARFDYRSTRYRTGVSGDAQQVKIYGLSGTASLTFSFGTPAAKH